MAKLIITRAGNSEGKSLHAEVFLNEVKIGIVKPNNDLESFEIPKGRHFLHVERDGLKSNQVLLREQEEIEIKLEILNYWSIQRILTVLLGWVMCSFCFHQATGLGVPLFLIMGLYVGYMVTKNKGKLTLRK